ncbi:type II secretion system protein [Anoxynatronum sibiricum]|uniref:Type II secretion system protein n=1 Tax=Anoxynatronum sibiricum TaxID=210623 RepID=A0ABU9VVM4_9CLOT
MTGRRKRKSLQGFSLLEIIMAVGILSLVSLYLLQIFVTAVRLNHQAADLDESVQLGNSIIQLLDSGLEKERLASQPFFQHAQIKQNGQSTSLTIGYDDKWQPVPHHSEPAIQPVYNLQVTATEQENAGGRLLTVALAVTRQQPYLLQKEDKPVIYQLETQRFLPREGGGQP